jgi:predicted  nucleic acid-binding Zn-ribbon protein
VYAGRAATTNTDAGAMTDLQPESREQAFDRGMEAGRVAEQLAAHGEHLGKINGSVEKSANALEALTNAVTELQTQSRNDREKLATTAEAVQKANDQNWRKLQRRFAKALYALSFLLVVLIILGVYLAVTA